ncbi:hypothetical protein WN55_00846 [Dufourea novaeangliae]|uniref:Uncharacterized protein n=1 Tax=Dufourea novaeangliae TaxID=178035 RepID=A0A154PD10_DUFNO|nr:hypothetical protein WN55_00846 [Dufourea novaeangliae]
MTPGGVFSTASGHGPRNLPWIFVYNGTRGSYVGYSTSGNDGSRLAAFIVSALFRVRPRFGQQRCGVALRLVTRFHEPLPAHVRRPGGSSVCVLLAQVSKVIKVTDQQTPLR